MKLGDKVVKDTGDYTFEGTIVAEFKKLTGEPRFVVEHDKYHLLFIFNEEQLRLRDIRDESS